MGKKIYLINAFFGLSVGLLMTVFAGILPFVNGEASQETIGWLVGGLVGMAFGYYQLRRYQKAKND